MPTAKELPILAFSAAKDFEKWLEKNHDSSPGLWLHMYKKDSKIPSITYAEGLDVALCYGWIDGLKRSKDTKSWLQKFTPRRPKGLWSKNNRDNIARLIKEKRMRPAGLKEVEAAKKDGRWDAAYDAAKTSTIPKYFLKRLHENKKATAFFESLNKANLYAITWRLQTAKKPETREKRMQAILEMLAKGQKFH